MKLESLSNIVSEASTRSNSFNKMKFDSDEQELQWLREYKKTVNKKLTHYSAIVQQMLNDDVIRTDFPRHLRGSIAIPDSIFRIPMVYKNRADKITRIIGKYAQYVKEQKRVQLEIDLLEDALMPRSKFKVPGD